MNKFQLQALECRESIPIYEKFAPKPAGSHLIKIKREKLYKYYKCDYCGDEIKIINKKQEMTGGIVVLPYTLTKRGELKLVICNKCLNPLLKEFEEV